MPDPDQMEYGITTCTPRTWLGISDRSSTVAYSSELLSSYSATKKDFYSFGSGSDSGSAEPQVRTPAPAQDSFIRHIENCLFFCYLTSENKIVITIYKNFFSDHDFFSIKFLLSL